MAGLISIILSLVVVSLIILTAGWCLIIKLMEK